MEGQEQGELSTKLASPADAFPTQENSITRFLYNQNPFYLISCLLVIYGCQSLAVSGGGLVQKSIAMTGGIASYTLLMAVVCVAVVRIAKVWDDARSIFIVVVLSLVAATTGFDELCIADQSTAGLFTIAMLVLVPAVIESVLWLCRIRLSFWYRVALYAHFLVLIGFPLLLGRAVATRNDPLANWGSVLFSVAMGASILLLIPAMRRGPESIKGNGTPWSWPLYPISAFVVLVVLAGIRSHAMWISFGFYGTAGKFEPFLLLPLLAAVLLTVAETGLGRGNQTLQRFAIVGTPGLLLCALTRGGRTFLPIQSDLPFLFGSSLTVAMAMVFGVYLWMTIRGVKYASFGLPTTLVLAGFLTPLPEFATAAGAQSWMLLALASVILLVMACRRMHADWMWTAVAGVTTSTIAMVGHAYGDETGGLIAAAAFAVTAMLIIGAVFSTDLAVLLRYLAAFTMSFAVLMVAFRSLQFPRSAILYVIAALAIVSLVYGMLIRRRGWLAVAAVHAILFVSVFSYHGHRSGQFRRINWPIASGLMCLGVGVAITTGKTGVYRRWIDRRGGDPPPGKPRRAFQPGL